MNRRAFLRRGFGQESCLDIDCERLFMHYVNARAEGKAAALLSRLGDELTSVSTIRLHQPFWVSSSELEGVVAPMLDAFRARGGVIETI